MGMISKAERINMITESIVLLPKVSLPVVFRHDFSNERHIHRCGINNSEATLKMTIGTNIICMVVILATASAGDVFIYNKGVLSSGKRQ